MLMRYKVGLNQSIATLAFLLVLFVSRGSVASAPSFIATPDNVAASASIGRLGSGSERTTVYAGNGKYYYQPAVLPEWDKYKTAVGKKCSSQKIREDTSLKKIPLTIWLDSPTYFKNLVSELSNYGLAGFSDKKLLFIPYDFARVALIKGGDETDAEIIYPTNKKHPALTIGYSSPQKNSIVPRIIARLNKSCQEHNQIITEAMSGEEVIKAYLYRVGTNYKSTSIHMLAGLSLHETLVAELFSEENTKVEFTTKNNASLNLPVIPSIPGGKRSGGGSSKVSAQRIVTRDVLDDMVSKIARRASIKCSGYDCNKLMSLALPKLLGESFGEAEMSRTKDGYAITGQQFGYVTITDSKIKGKVDNALDAKKSSTVKIAGEADITQENDAKSSGSGELDATMPIATIADVVVISKDKINSIIDYQISQDIPQDGKSLLRVNFIYPSMSYSDGEALSEQHAENLLVLEKQCKSGSLRTSHNFPVPSVRSARRHEPGAWTGWIRAKPLKGKYIESFKPHATSSHNGKIRQQHTTYMDIGPRKIAVKNMVSGTSARFKCGRGHNLVKRRRCTASGYIATLQQPMECAQFLVPEYRIATGK